MVSVSTEWPGQHWGEIFSPRGNFLENPQWDTELGLRAGGGGHGEGTLLNPQHPTHPGGPLPFLEKGEACSGIQVWGMGDSVQFQQKGQMAVDQGFTGSCPGRGFRGGRVGTSPLLCLRPKPGQSPGQPVLGRTLKGTELGKITHAPPHAIHNCACTCVIGDICSTAGFIIIQQKDVAYCQEQILLDTWVIVRDWGVGGEESPWLQGGREHVGQENGPGPGPEPVPRGSSHCAALGARPPHHRVRRQKPLEEDC